MQDNTMNEDKGSSTDDYPLALSLATRMLAEGLDRAFITTGATQKDIAKQLGYKTSVVLSHMALGRVPIPIDRAPEIALTLKLDRAQFLLATLEQRHPNIDFEGLFGVQMPAESALSSDLEVLAGSSLDDLPDATKQVLREVVASKQPERRWLSSAELPIIEMIRRRFPALDREGLAAEDRQGLIACLRQKDKDGSL
jgi:hypothetical protein